MTVFVDNAYIDARGNTWCHMACDSADLTELHDLAKSIGLRRDWLHDSSMPHYDVTPSKRQLAIQKGAIAIDKTEMVKLMQRYRVKCAECGKPFAEGYLYPDETPTTLCEECADKQGFCRGCGLFWGGCEDFDFDWWGTGMCQECSMALRAELDYEYESWCDEFADMDSEVWD